MLQEITKKVVSYCEIPEEITEDHWISEFSCDCYIMYSLNEESTRDLDKWLREEYPELIGTSFLIHMDY